MFDPYHKWLGIKPGQRPPTHYQLLGIEADEQDPEVIEEAAVRQTTHLRAYQIGAHADDCTRLLNEISQARTILLNPAKRKAYDTALARNPARKAAGAPAELAHALQPGRPTVPAFAFTAEPEPFVAPLSGRNGTRSSRSQTVGSRSSLTLWLALGGVALVATLGLVIVVLLFRKTPEPSAMAVPVCDPLPPVVKKGIAERPAVGPKKVVGDPPAQPVIPPPVEPPLVRPVDPLPPPQEPAPVPRKAPPQDPPVAVTAGPARQLTADWNPAGRLAFSADSRRVLFGAQDATVRLHDAATGAELRRFVGHTQSVLAVAFAPDGVHALSGAGDNTLRLWEVETGRQVRLFQGHTAPVTVVLFTPDGRSALSASQDHTVRLWDVQTGQELHRFEGHTGPVAALTLSRDGQYAASGGEDKLVTIWSVPKRREVGHIRANGVQHGISDLELFPDGERLLACSGFKDALVWPFKVNGNRSAQPLRGHTDKVVTASLSGDGRLALSGSYDRTARLWDVASGRELCRLEGHAAPVTRVALSPDGRYALTGSGDQIVRLWELAKGP